MSPAKATAKPEPKIVGASETTSPNAGNSGGLSRSGSLSDRLISSWRGGVSSLLKRSQDNVRAEALAKARRSKQETGGKDDHPPAKPVIMTKGKEPVELPAPLKSPSQTTDSKSTSKSSPIDPAYSPNRKQFRTSHNGPPVPSKSPLPEQTSFFEDSSSDEDESPVIQRANSVRVGKPTLVRHHSNAAASQAVKHEHSPAPRTGVSKETAAMQDSIDASAPVSQSATARDAEAEPTSQPSSSMGQGPGPADALSRLEGTNSDSPRFATKLLPLTPASHPPSAQFSIKPLIESPSHSTAISAPHPTPASVGPNNVAAESSATNAISAKQSSLPFPNPLSPLSALHSNPVSPSTASAAAALNTIPRLSRTLSAPTPPNRNPNRRVTIRPSDLVIVHSDHDHRLFRDSVVTTPYPETGAASDSTRSMEGRIGRSRSLGGAFGRTRGSLPGDERRGLTVKGATTKRLSDIPDDASHRDITEAEERSLAQDQSDEDNEHDSSSRQDGGQRQNHVQLLDPPMSPHGPGDRDRFPSLSSSESLFLVLSIAGHPHLSTTVEIEVPPNTLALAASSNNTTPSSSLFSSLRTHRPHRNRLSKSPPPPSSQPPSPAPPFDDATLFHHLSTAYTTLLHTHHLHLFAPTRTPCSLQPATPDMHALDGPSFLAHLRNPRLGAGRRGWLLWLRNQQVVGRKRASSLFSTAAADVGVVVGGSPTSVSGSVGAGGGGGMGSYPRMPFQRSEMWGGGPPRVVLGYRFRWGVIAGAVLGWLVVGAVVVVMWVLVGLPGGRAGQRGRSGDGGLIGGDGAAGVMVLGGDVLEEGMGVGVVSVMGGERGVGGGNGYGTGDWRVDSQMRVLTALVMGGGVSAAGLILTGLWVLGGWILL